MLGCRTLIRSWNMWKNRAPNRLTIVTTSGTYSRGLFWCGLIAVAGVTVASCAHKAAPVPDAMHIMVCDTTPMKPLGRRVEIPEIAPRPNQAGLTGSIVQAETGDAIEGALISLRPINQPPKPVPPFRYTNATGGFSFDDLEAGSYRVLVRRIGENADTATIHVETGQVDTLTFRLHAFRCYGY